MLGAEVVLDVFPFPVLLVHVGMLAAAGSPWARRVAPLVGGLRCGPTRTGANVEIRSLERVI